MSGTPTRMLGDRPVAAIGLGAMTLTQVRGYDPARGMRTVHAALDRGQTLIDTADVYGPPGGGDGVNERAVAEALRRYPGPTDHVVVATKGGHLRYAEHDTWWIDGSPRHLRRACLASLRRLGLDPLPLYQHHRPDPRVPYAETMGALKALYDEGLVRRVGISNADEPRIRLAHSVLGPALVSVQNEFSPARREAAREIAVCAELGLAFLSWGPLGGMRAARGFGAAGGPFHEIAAARGVTPHQVALAWQLHVSPVVIPIPGASRPETAVAGLDAAGLHLSAQELRRLGTG